MLFPFPDIAVARELIRVMEYKTIAKTNCG